MRGYNFGAGPATLPEAVLKQVQAELLEWQDTGMSVMEISHRSQAFMQLAEQAQSHLRALLAIPNNYQVLFLSGPARQQFSTVPMNLLGENPKADYLVSGIWSAMAANEAKRYGDIQIAATSEASNYQQLPTDYKSNMREDARYLYFCSNETVNGIAFPQPPISQGAPLVADMTSDFLSKPITISDYGVIFAGVQKNLGPAGLTIVIIRDDLIQTPQPHTPTTLDYNMMRDNQSLYYTPATFSLYVCARVLAWLQAEGGLEVIGQRNQEKAQYLYDYIDSSRFYSNPVEKSARSTMNVPFLLADGAHNGAFVDSAAQAGLLALKGHRLVGGMRASIYNAMPFDGVKALVNFMQRFAEQYSR